MTDRQELCAKNNDRELWREREGDYANSIHVTEHGGIGINVGGTVIVMSLKAWHELAALARDEGQVGINRWYICHKTTGHGGP